MTKVLGSHFKQLGVVVQFSDPGVACEAKQPTDLTIFVTMVNAEAFQLSASTDTRIGGTAYGTDTILSFEEFVVHLSRDPVRPVDVLPLFSVGRSLTKLWSMMQAATLVSVNESVPTVEASAPLHWYTTSAFACWRCFVLGLLCVRRLARHTLSVAYYRSVVAGERCAEHRGTELSGATRSRRTTKN